MDMQDSEGPEVQATADGMLFAYPKASEHIGEDKRVPVPVVPLSELKPVLDAYQRCLEGAAGYERKLANLYMALEPLRLKYGEKIGTPTKQGSGHDLGIPARES